MTPTARRAALLLCALLPLQACNDSPTAPTVTTTSQLPTTTAPSTYRPLIVPADYSTRIDNPFLPFAPGDRWTYKGTSADGTETVVVAVLPTTKTVMGVRCVVVHDTVSVDGEVVEDTYDWYAQHRDGSVWYFGEDTKELEGGRVVSTEGAWEAGVAGALPGIVMPGTPAVGQHFRQEYAVGEAEDEFTVLATDARATLASGPLTGLVQTRDTTRLDPEVVEHKYYARGIGVVLEEHIKGPAERFELVTTTRR